MKRLMMLLAGILFFMSQDLSAIMITSHNDGPEDVFKNPAVTAFSNSSWIMILDYKALDEDYSVDVKSSGTNLNYHLVDRTEYNESVSFGNIISHSDGTSYYFSLSGVDNYLVKYKEEEFEFRGYGISTKSKEYQVGPMLNVGYSKKMNTSMSYGLSLATAYVYSYKNNEQDDGTTVEMTTEKIHSVTSDLTFGLFLKSEEYNSELGFSVSSGEVRYLYSYKYYGDELSAVENEKTLVNVFDYVSSPQISLGAFIMLTGKLGVGFEGIMQLPSKYEDDSINDDATGEITLVYEKSPLIVNRIIVSYSFTKNFKMETDFSKAFTYASAHDTGNNAESETTYDLYSVDLLMKLLFDKTSLYAGVTYDYAEFSSIEKDLVASTETKSEVRNHSLKASLGIGRSF